MFKGRTPPTEDHVSPRHQLVASKIQEETEKRGKIYVL